MVLYPLQNCREKEKLAYKTLNNTFNKIYHKVFSKESLMVVIVSEIYKSSKSSITLIAMNIAMIRAKFFN